MDICEQVGHETMLGTRAGPLTRRFEISSYAFMNKAKREGVNFLCGTVQLLANHGGMDEWFKSHAWKACLG